MRDVVLNGMSITRLSSQSIVIGLTGQARSIGRSGCQTSQDVSIHVGSAGTLPFSPDRVLLSATTARQQASVERRALRVATIRSDFPQGHAGGQTGRWDKTAGQS
jgi:hypothetical protein